MKIAQHKEQGVREGVNEKKKMEFSVVQGRDGKFHLFFIDTLPYIDKNFKMDSFSTTAFYNPPIYNDHPV